MTTVSATTGLTYGASGKLMDVYRPAQLPVASPAVLLWHGRGPDERDVLAPLAHATAQLGVIVFVPDWRADAPDGGRQHLKESVAFVREHAADFGADAEQIILAGWSRGAKAAMGVALNPAAFDGLRPRAVIGIAGGYRTAAPTTGTIPIEDLLQAAHAPALPVRLVHGTDDPVVDIEQSREMHKALAERDWPVTLDEVATDHAGIVMTEYSPEHQRCLPTVTDHVVAAGSRTAHAIAEVAGALSEATPLPPPPCPPGPSGPSERSTPAAAS